jgi:TRAP-type C4-dicarboxylate transport system permease small subunit
MYFYFSKNIEGVIVKLLLRIFDKIIEALSVVVLFIIFFSISLQTITRYFGIYIPVWTEEVARFSLVWIVSLGAIIYLKEEGFRPGVEVIINKLTPKIQKVVYILLSFLIIFFLAILLRYSLEITLKNINTFSPAAKIPIKYVYSGFIVMSIVYLRYFVEFLYNKIKS